MTNNRSPPETGRRTLQIFEKPDWGQLDCLSEAIGLGDFQEVKKLSQAVELDGTVCRILRIEALITAKNNGASERH